MQGLIASSFRLTRITANRVQAGPSAYSGFELSIGLKGLSVGEGEDLHHDYAGDPHRRVNPVICIEQTGPRKATCVAAVENGINIDMCPSPHRS